MPEATLDVGWVPKAACPLTATIVSVEPFEEKFKGRPYTSYRLMLQSKDLNFYQYEAKFGDKNVLINSFGSSTESWTGKQVTIAVDEESRFKRLYPEK